MRRPAAVLALVLVALLVGSSAGSAATNTVVFPGCGGSDHARYKPTYAILLCGDGGFRAKSLKWSSWTRTSASGTGTGRVNTCDPNCAQGEFKSYPIKLTLSRARLCANGKREFRRVAYSFPKTHPSGSKRSGTRGRSCSR